MEPAAELVFAGRSALLGAALIFTYDIIRFVRRIIPHGNIAVGITDMLYWIFFTVAVFLMIYMGYDGRIRAFMFAGMAFGMFLYRALLWKVKIFQKQLRYLVKLFKIGKGKE